MLTTQEQKALEQIKQDIRALPSSMRGRLMGMVFDVQHRIDSLHDHFDRTMIEMARLRGHKTDQPSK